MNKQEICNYLKINKLPESKYLTYMLELTIKAQEYYQTAIQLVNFMPVYVCNLRS